MKLFLLIVTLLALTGCLSPKSFSDPTYPKVSYDQLQRRSTPLRLTLSSEFQRNGARYPRADPLVQENAERVLRASGIVTPVANDAQGQIRIVVNNIADVGEARAKGFGTGLTFGLVGTTVIDAYEMSLEISVGLKTFTRTAVKHAIHTAIGNTSTPPGLEAFSPQVAFERALEQMILRALSELQQDEDGVGTSKGELNDALLRSAANLLGLGRIGLPADRASEVSPTPHRPVEYLR